MSLIDEALKRAELEAARRDGLHGGAYPWVPEHAPRRRRRWAWITAVLACAGAVAAALLLLSRRETISIQNPRSKIQNQKLETVEVAPPPAGLPSKAQASGKAAQGSKPRGESRPPVTAPADVAYARIAPAAESHPSRAPVEGKPARGLVDGRTYAGEVAVPDGGKIELGGIVFSESSPVALLNGKALGPGAVVEEFTIVAITPDRVELKGRGVTIFLVLK